MPATRPLLVLTWLLLVSAGGVNVGCSSSGEAAAGHQHAPSAHVALAPVKPGPLMMEWVLFGEVRAQLRAALGAGAEGEVRRVWVREGDRVQAGDRLMQIDGSVLQARVSAARAAQTRVEQERAQAERELERFNRAGSELVAGVEIERAASQAEVLAAESQSQRAALREASAELRRHIIRAPFSGVVSARRIDPGDWVTQGTSAFELVADDAREVFVGAPAALLPHIHVGDVAEVRGAERSLSARVVGVVDALDPRTRTAPVRLALLPAEENSSMPPAGATVDVSFRAAMRGDGAWVAPRDAVVQGPAGDKVWLVRRGETITAEPVTVEVLARGISDVLIRGEGITAGVELVVRGNERIRPGQELVVEAL